MRVASRQRKDIVPLHNFTLHSSALPHVNTVNDLGVLVDSHLTFSCHINAITQKANQRCYLILKSFQSRDRNLLIKAFITYVRPLLETNSQVWSPHLLKDIRRIEAVQRRFTKKLEGLHTLTVSQSVSQSALHITMSGEYGSYDELLVHEVSFFSKNFGE